MKNKIVSFSLLFFISSFTLFYSTAFGNPYELNYSNVLGTGSYGEVTITDNGLDLTIKVDASNIFGSDEGLD